MSRPKGKLTIEEYDAPQSLLTTTRTLLKQDARTLNMISQSTAIPYYWLKKFSAGEIPNPAVNRVQYLYEFITKKELLK